MKQVSAPFTGIEFVFLDRDGVINRKAPESQYIWQWNQFHLLANADEAIAALNRSGMRVIIVTNQRGVSLGFYALDEVVALHTRLQQQLAEMGRSYRAFYICPHGSDECNCRKPKSGLWIAPSGISLLPTERTACRLVIRIPMFRWLPLLESRQSRFKTTADKFTMASRKRKVWHLEFPRRFLMPLTRFSCRMGIESARL